MGLWFQRPVRLALLAGAVVFLPCLTPEAGAEPTAPAVTPSAPLVSGIRGVELVVSELERSRESFERLGFIAAAEQELSGPSEEQRTGVGGARVRSLELALGSERLTLRQFIAPSGGRAVPSDSRGNDLWFQHVAIVVRDMSRAYRWLRAHHVSHVSSGPQTLPRWNRNAAGIEAFYFADPDGHTLELLRFPPGKGAPRWQARPACTRTPAELCEFLGIDHTAITVSDTDASLALYRDRLGMQVAGASENYGPEQERLNGVFAARLRITSLRAGSGIGLERLEYLAPRGGRPAPRDARASDLSHWQIDLVAPRPTAVIGAVQAAGGRTVSLGGESGEQLLRDRDGHALFVSE